MALAEFRDRLGVRAHPLIGAEGLYKSEAGKEMRGIFHAHLAL